MKRDAGYGMRDTGGWGRWLTLFGLLAGAPVTAHAHLVQSGFGTFYDGAIHLVVTPADVMLVLGLGLLAGLRGRTEARAVVLALPVAWLIGGAVGMWQAIETTPAWLTTATFGLTGVLVALDVRLSRVQVAAFAAVGGALHGWSNGATMAPGGADWLALAGAAVTALVLVTLIAASLVGVQAQTPRIVVRVAGSWLAAISMLMTGWLLRGGA
jgi:hydrogenase/urease accessory protein HupE